MVTVLDIVDTSVKIGIGVLISAVAAHVQLRRQHAHEMAKERLAHRRENVHRVSDALVTYWGALLKVTASGNRRTWLGLRDAAAIARARRELLAAHEGLAQALFRASLLKSEVLSSELDQYYDQAAKIYEVLKHVGAMGPVDNLRAAMNDLATCSRRVRGALANVYDAG